MRTPNQPPETYPALGAARRNFIITHLAGGLAGLAGALVCVFAGPHHPAAEWAAFLWLASPLVLGALALACGRQALAKLEAASSLNAVLVLTALAALSGGLSSLFLLWLIVVPAEAALTRRPRLLLLTILEACVAIGALWLLTNAHALPMFVLGGMWGASVRALALMGAVAYAGVLAAEVQRVHHRSVVAIANREASYRFLTENAADPILRLTAAGQVVYASPSSHEVFGGADPTGAQATELVDDADRGALHHALVRAAYFGEEALVVCRAGDRFIEIRACAVAREEPRRRQFFWRSVRQEKPAREIIAIARDVTAHRALEDRLERLWRAAEAQSAAKSRFLANMSHELRTPLNSILGFSQMIGGEMLGPIGNERYREYAGLIEESGNYLLELINDILDTAKIEAGKFKLVRETLDVGEALKRTLRVMLPQYKEKGVALDIEIAPGLPKIEADARGLRQIAFNLLSNALKFTPVEGRVSVRLHANEKALVLDVKDTGIGIDSEDMKRLAKPFEQADDSYVKAQTGTGLGLSLVRALVGLHGGTLTLRSKRGQGTLVSVSLPLVVKPAIQQAA